MTQKVVGHSTNRITPWHPDDSEHTPTCHLERMPSTSSMNCNSWVFCSSIRRLQNVIIIKLHSYCVTPVWVWRLGFASKEPLFSEIIPTHSQVAQSFCLQDVGGLVLSIPVPSFTLVEKTNDGENVTGVPLEGTRSIFAIARPALRKTAISALRRIRVVI